MYLTFLKDELIPNNTPHTLHFPHCSEVMVS